MSVRLRRSYDPAMQTPKTGKILQVWHDSQTAAWGYTPRPIVLRYNDAPPANALPDTVPLSGCKAYGDFVSLDEPWQWFWFGLLERAAPLASQAELLAAWASLTANARALTDGHAVQNGYRDYVLNLNPAGPDMAIKCLTMGGNIVEWTGAYQGGKHVIKTLDVRQSPPLVDDVWGDWTLIHWATESTVLKLPDGTYQSGRFPQLDPYGTPFPLVSLTGTNLLEKQWARQVDNGISFSPYNP